MKIGLHDSEREYLKRKTFPNYALMKISAYHKSLGDTVEWWVRDRTGRFAATFLRKSSKGHDRIKMCGIQLQIHENYTVKSSCRVTDWCVVPEKEGGIKPYRTWKELVRQDSDKLVLMDNNILACEYGINQLESLIGSGYRIDLNQGMDARLVTDRIAEILSKLKWIKYLRFSCDTKAQIKAVENAAELLQRHGVKPYKLFIYLLVTPDLEDAAYRVERLKRLSGITIYAQAERNERLGIIPNKMQLEFAQRYVYSGKYRTETWQEYYEKRSG